MILIHIMMILILATFTMVARQTHLNQNTSVMGILKKLIRKKKSNQYTQEEKWNEFLLNCSGLLSERQNKEREKSIEELIKTVDELKKWANNGN